MPHGHRDGQSHGGAFAILGGKEVSDKGEISVVFDVEFPWIAELELRMVDALLRDDLASDQENTSDLKIGDCPEHAHLAEGVLSEAVKPLHETFEQILELVLNLTLLAELLIVQEPEGVALDVNISHHLGVTFAYLVGYVDEVGLEVVEVEGAGRKGIQGVDLLLGGVLSLRFGGASSLLTTFLGLLLCFKDRLESLLRHLDLSEAGHELREGGDASEPGARLGSRLGETLV